MKYYASSNAVEFECSHYPMNIITRSRSSTQYVIPVTGPIGEIYEYGELVRVLVCATHEDEVYIRLSSPGGNMETCDYLCRRMEQCEASITVEIGFTCASAASAIAFHADEWVIHDSSTMMIHSCSYSPGRGKESDIRGVASFIERVNYEWVDRTYQGFLTDEEFDDVLDNGKDLYFFADELRERFSLYQKDRAERKARKAKAMKQYWEDQYAA